MSKPTPNHSSEPNPTSPTANTGISGRESAACVRGGWSPEFTTRTSVPPIFQTTAFDMHDLQQLESVAAGRENGFIYTRDGNPNHEAFAADVASLEGADAGLVAASGMGALSAVLMSSLQSGDHVIAARVLYGRTFQLLNHLSMAFGVNVTYVDAMQPGTIAAARTSRSRFCIVESISNPLMEVADLPRIREESAGLTLLVDSTFATPCLLKPVEFGADLVWHSASKYLNGHGDVMLGVIVGNADLVRRARGMVSLIGANSNPFECWLASRGLRTLPLRIKQASSTAMTVAEFLTRQVGVQQVFYPGLPSHPSRDHAQKLLKNGCGGMLAFELAGGRTAVSELFRRLADSIPFSPTLADARSTVSYPAGTSHKFMSASDRAAFGIGDGLVRFSVGLEEPELLCQELGAAIRDLPPD